MQIEKFMKTIKGLADNTRRAYQQTLWQYDAEFGGAEPTAAGMQKFLNHFSPSSLYRHKAALKAYWEWLTPEVMWPFNRRTFLAPRQHKIRYVPADAVAEMVKKTTNPADRMFLRTLFQLGCRIHEIKAIEQESLEEDGVFVKTKGGQPKLKVLTKEFMAELRKYAKGKSGKIFPMSYNYYYVLMKRLGAQVGHPEVAPHMIRHCLSPESMVIQPRGAQPLFNLLLQNTGVMAVDIGTGMSFPGTVTEKAVHDGKMLEIWAGGQRLCCGPEHRLFKSDLRGGIEEIDAKHIRSGMYLAGVRSLKTSDIQTLNPDAWRFIGYFLGDGYMRKREISLYDKNIKTVEFYKVLLAKQNIESKIIRSSDRNSYKLTLSNVYFDNFMREIGVNSEARRVPTQAFQSRGEDIAQLVAGFYDAEGNEGTSCRMFNSSVRLLQDIQILLLYLGINGHIDPQWRMVKLPQGKSFHSHIFTLRVGSQYDKARFVSMVPTLKKITSVREPQGYDRDLIPIGHYLKEKVQERRKTGQILPESLSRYGVENHQPTRRNLNNWIPFIDTPIIHKMLAFTWLKVNKVLGVNYKTRLIDIGVSPTEAFIVDGFISHNSRAVDLLDAGMPLPYLQQFLGHASINTTAIYTQLRGGDLSKQLEKIEGERKKRVAA